MDIAAFYAVVAGVNFTLLGLWWVAVHERIDVRDRASRRMAYVVALQFMVPGTTAPGRQLFTPPCNCSCRFCLAAQSSIFSGGRRAS